MATAAPDTGSGATLGVLRRDTRAARDRRRPPDGNKGWWWRLLGCAVVLGAGGKAIAWNEAIVVSRTAFHGRDFFSAVFQPGDPQAAVAAVAALVGLLIEITFIATFNQRFFAR